VKVQERALTLVSKAYRTIRTGDLRDLLGLTEEEVKQGEGKETSLAPLSFLPPNALTHP